MRWVQRRADRWSFATTSVLVRAITTNAFDPGQRIDQQLNMVNQRQLAQSEPVAAVAARSLQTTATPAQLLEHVQVDVPANSQILRVRYRDTVPETARRGADAFARAYLAFREADARAQAKASQTSLLKDVARLNNQVAAAEKVIRSPRATASDRQAAQARLSSLNNRLQPLNVQLNGFLSLDFTPGTVIAAAPLPTRPASPNRRLDAGVGLLVGLFLGVVLGFVRDRTDDRLRGRAELAGRLDRPVLAAVPPRPGGSARGAHPQVSGFAGTGVEEDEGQHLQRIYPPAGAHGGPGRFALRPAAHRRLEQDAPFLRHLHVVKYEHLVADPQGTLARIAAFLDLDGDLPGDGIDSRRSATYERQWTDLTTGRRRRGHLRRLCRRHEPAANHFGYSLLDLTRADPFPAPTT